MKQARFLVLCVVFAAFMARLDTNIISVALPTLSSFFHVQAATTANLMLSFLIVVTAMLIPLGYLGDRIGFRTLLIAGYLFFTLGSLLCGVVNGFTLLVAARAVQGIGAAMLMISAYSLVPQRLGPESVGKAMGWMAVAGSMGILLGAPLGGILIEWFSWRAIFLINLPVGVIAIFLVWRTMLPDKAKPAGATPETFDWLGATLAIDGLILFCFALGRLRNDFFALNTWLLLSSGGLLIILFLIRQGSSNHPLIDPNLWLNPLFCRGLGMQSLVFLALASHSFSTPFYLDIVLELSPQNSGLAMALFPIGIMLAAPAAGRWADQIQPAIICRAAATGGALTSAIFTLFVYLGIYSAIYTYLFFLGLCLGAYLGPGAKLLLTGAPQVKQGTITGIFHTTNNLSLVIGVSVASLMLHLGQKAANTELGAGLPGEPFLPLYLFNVVCFAAAALLAFKIDKLVKNLGTGS
ncbi:MAG: MFS transporter [Pseudomonadota bacterium]|nr:MFS transporter [Pseudomonadota bacterium]